MSCSLAPSCPQEGYHLEMDLGELPSHPGSSAKVVQKNIQVICRIITSGTLILSRRIGSHVEFDFRALRNWARAGMVEWNGIFRLFRFSGILGQPREVHPKFRNEIPENVCSIRSQSRNFRNFWSSGKRPWSLQKPNSLGN